MDRPRVTLGDVAVGIGSGLLVVSLFLPWYGVSFDLAGFSKSDSGTGREVLGSMDMLLFLIAVSAIAIVVARAAGALPDRRPARVAVVALGALAVLLVLYRIVEIPTSGPVPAHVELSRKIGIFIALLGAATIAYGGRPTAARGEGRRRRVGAERARGEGPRGSNRAGVAPY